MTRIQRVIFNAGAWMPRPTPLRAIMPISVTVEGDTSALVPDLCHELARELTWAEYGETVIPADAAPRGTITGGERRARLRRAAHLAWTRTNPLPSTARPTLSQMCLRFGLY